MAASIAARDVSAETPPKTPVSVTIAGRGSVRLVVADGTTRPCESSDNHMLFNGHARAGEVIEVTSVTGSVCVDHTYGAFRESLWAGASIWSGSGAGYSGVRALHGSVSTDEP
jgi:hypothetical protein